MRHTLWLTSLAVLLLAGYVRSVEIPVCCPAGYKFDVGRFECVAAADANAWNGIPIDTDTIYGYNLRTSNSSQIPHCDKPILVKVRFEVRVSPYSCLVKIFNELYAISCPSEINVGAFHQISVIRKCCPFSQSYDAVAKTCIASDQPLDMYRQSFHHPIVFANDGLKCSDDDVVVEYFADYQDIKLIDNKVIILGSNKIEFDTDSYCLEMALANGSDLININSIPSNKLMAEPSMLLQSRMAAAAGGVGGDVLIMIRTCNGPTICDHIPCIRRCCGDHMKYARINGTSQCVADTSDLQVLFHNFEARNGKFETVIPKVYGFYRGLECPKYRLDPDMEESDVHYISYLDGSLFFPTTYSTYDNMEYCIEKIDNGFEQTISTFLCFEDTEKDKLKFNLYSIGLLVSSLFFTLTLVVYLCIPKLRNLPGKILICLVISLLIAYLGIAIGQISPPNDRICYSFAFFIYFSLMAAFAWMNVMCFDIWLTFGSSEHSHGIGRRQTKRFVFYSLYGWGMPSFLTTITILLTKYDLLNKELRPKFGHGRCWFQHVHAASQLLFFLGPVGILFLINFVLFVLTLRYCNKVKREIHRMQSSNTQKPLMRRRFFVDKAQFLMNTKLFIVMGILWFLEILSALFYDRKRTFFWVISDFFNVLQGVFVFFIFVFKWRVWYAIQVRFGIQTRNSPRHGITTTGATNSGVNMMRLTSTMETSTSLLNLNDPNRLSPSIKL